MSNKQTGKQTAAASQIAGFVPGNPSEDHTDRLFELCMTVRKYLLRSQNSYGKNVVLSQFESLFRYGLRDFKGLKIEQLWNDHEVYSIVKLDFSEVVSQAGIPFEETMNRYLLEKFSEIGFERKNTELSFDNELELFVNSLRLSSLVLLIANADAPIIAAGSDKELFEEVRRALQVFFSVLSAQDGALRFVFVTATDAYTRCQLFSLSENLIDLNPQHPSIPQLRLPTGGTATGAALINR